MATFAYEPVVLAQVGPDLVSIGKKFPIKAAATFKAGTIAKIDASDNPDSITNAASGDSANLVLTAENAVDTAYLAPGEGFSSTKTHAHAYSLKGRRVIISTGGAALANSHLGGKYDLAIDGNGQAYIDLSATTDQAIRVVEVVPDFAKDNTGVWKYRGVGDTGARVIAEFVDSACWGG